MWRSRSGEEWHDNIRASTEVRVQPKSSVRRTSATMSPLAVLECPRHELSADRGSSTGAGILRQHAIDRYANPAFRDAGSHLEQRTLGTPLIDDRQHAKRPTVGERVVGKINAPSLRGPGGSRRSTAMQRDVFVRSTRSLTDRRGDNLRRHFLFTCQRSRGRSTQIRVKPNCGRACASSRIRATMASGHHEWITETTTCD